MSISCRYAEDLENLVLCILENGTTADEVKGIVDDCVEIMQDAANDAAENSRSKRETSCGQTKPQGTSAGAESADIGKLDAVDESEPCLTHGAYIRTVCSECGDEVPDISKLPEQKFLGSAETGGEKAAPQPDSDLEQVISLIRQVTGPTGGWLISPADFGNQIVQTLYNREADSREPERLNNAQESDEDEICAKCRHCSHEGRCGMRESECQSSCDCVALAESSPGSPPPEECDEFRGNDPKACSTCQRPVQDHRCIVWPVEYLTREEVEKRYPRK